MALTLVTPNTTAVITTALAKSHLRVIETGEDTLIDRLVLAARRWVEDETDRDLLDTVWDETFTAWPPPAGRLRLSRAPLSSVTSIKYYDENDDLQTWSTDEYTAHTPRTLRGWVALAPSYTSWPVTRQDRDEPITVRYTAGYGTTAASIPELLLQAVYLVLDDMYRLRGGSTSGIVTPAGHASVKSILGHFSTGDYP